MAEINQRGKKLIDLINQLSTMADDETSTQEAINEMIGQVKAETAAGIQDNIREAEEVDDAYINEKIASDIKHTVTEQATKVIGELMGNGHFDGCNCNGNDAMQPINEPSNKFYFTRIREVKAPGKAHPTDAGIDFYVPNEKAWDEDFKDKVIKYSRNSDTIDLEFTDKGLIVLPNAHVAIPSGIKTIIPQGLGMMFVNKSGVATKMKLDHSACLVDSEYRDEIIMCFFNHNTEPVLIEPGMKITQGLIVPIINLEMNEVLNCVYDDMGKETDRGGGFGSSGTK